MARLTRHEILKEDHFLLFIEKSRDLFLTRRKEVLISAGVIALALVGYFGIRYGLAALDEKSKEALSAALKIYHAPLTGSPEAPYFDLTFPTANERLEKSLAQFQSVSSSYGSRSAGKIAQYYAGLCLRDLNKPDQAIRELEPLSKEKSDYGALALQALVSIYENSGNTAKAIEAYQRIVSDDTSAAPNSVALLYLAKLYEHQNQLAEATSFISGSLKISPGTPYASDAEQKLKQLSR